MNFAQMLAMDVKPLSDTRSTGPEREKWKRDTKAANAALHSKTAKKYCEAIGKEWVSTADTAIRLDMERASIIKQLNKYATLGILERRPLGGKPYSHRTGWEWRVK